MDASAITKITELAEPHYKEFYGRMYSDKPMGVVKLPTCEKVTTNTLSGLVSIVEEEFDKIASLPLFVLVEGHSVVNVFSSIVSEDMHRDTLCVAEMETHSFPFERYLSYEDMIIKLRTMFEQTSELEDIIRLLGNITDEQSVQTLDDGITQNAVVRKGINLKDRKNINPIVKLRPRRTFLEVEQPESEFLFRLKEGSAALFEADGGAWKLTARKNIAEYLKNELSELIEEGKVIVIE